MEGNVSADFEMPKVKNDQDVSDDVVARVKAKREELKERKDQKPEERKPMMSKNGGNFITAEEYEKNKENANIFVLQVAQRASRELVKIQDEKAKKKGNPKLEAKYVGIINAAKVEGFDDEQINRIAMADFGKEPEGGLTKEEIEKELRGVENAVYYVSSIIRLNDKDAGMTDETAFVTQAYVIEESANKLDLPVSILVGKYVQGKDFVAVMTALGFVAKTEVGNDILIEYKMPKVRGVICEYMGTDEVDEEVLRRVLEKWSNNNPDRQGKRAMILNLEAYHERDIVEKLIEGVIKDRSDEVFGVSLKREGLLLVKDGSLPMSIFIELSKLNDNKFVGTRKVWTNWEDVLKWIDYRTPFFRGVRELAKGIGRLPNGDDVMGVVQKARGLDETYVDRLLSDENNEDRFGDLVKWYLEKTK